jgi:hypothetical protein
LIWTDVIAIAHATEVTDGEKPLLGGGQGEHPAPGPALTGHGVDVVGPGLFGLEVLATWICKFCRRIFFYTYL